YPDGQDDYPVGGISWYEAAAYCAFAGKSLPTLHQWYQAADLFNVEAVVQFSNFGADGPAPVGHPLRLGAHGTYDMAGNVKEWAWNEATEGRRYVLGGAWNEASYQFHGWDAQPPRDRKPTYGVRCAIPTGPLPAEQTAPVAAPFVDWRAETPVRDEVFAIYKSLYDYDRTPLEPRIDPDRDEFEHWWVERVSFAAAYGNERVSALLFLPRNVNPPYQTVMYFPGLGPWLTPSPPPTSFDDLHTDTYWLLGLVRGGRAVLYPAYKGAFDRHIGSPLLPHIWRDIVIHSAKDLRRAVDYLVTRSDVDGGKLAHFGISTGAAVGTVMAAVEPRFQASVLLAGGAFPWRHPPEVEAFNFAPRVRVATLMINGRHDFYYPYETSQAPLFELLGTEKRHKVFESAHIPAERAEVMREVLDWLDRYLGPVNRP
ncbi:MAG TPA: SUMF1/EgtB/PvdO family nonheme iron enzyme, partial [Longimicrobiales bacterium]|nr:SUMF1/EgtB/PvdO family nonheme iron enzyme [Longimicrobiales bacterium]